MAGILNQIAEFKAKNEAAHSFIRELLAQSVATGGVEGEAMENVLKYLLSEGKSRGSEATGGFDEISCFVLDGPCVSVIAHRRFRWNDLMVLKNFHPEALFHFELIGPGDGITLRFIDRIRCRNI